MTDRPENLHIRVIDWGKQHGELRGELAMLRHLSTGSASLRCHLTTDRPAHSKLDTHHPHHQRAGRAPRRHN